jgi:hypothetical protein
MMERMSSIKNSTSDGRVQKTRRVRENETVVESVTEVVNNTPSVNIFQKAVFQ